MAIIDNIGGNAQAQIDALNESLGKRNLQTYTDIAQIGGKVSNTVTELFALLPINSELIYFVGNSSTDALNKSLPLTDAGELTITKNALDTRGLATYKPYHLNHVYVNCYRNGFLGWERLALNSDLANYLPLAGGTLRGNSELVLGGQAQAQFAVANDMGSCMLVVTHTGECGVYDIKRNRWIATSDEVAGVVLHGLALKAQCDENGNNIADTYAKVQKGTGIVSIVSATQTPTQTTIPFLTSFERAPVLLINSKYREYIDIVSVDKNGFTVSGMNNSTSSLGNVNFTWVAIE